MFLMYSKIDERKKQTKMEENMRFRYATTENSPMKYNFF